MGEDLVVPEIHVQRKFIVYAFHIESCHVTDNALQWPVKLHLGHEQVRIYLERVSGLLVFIVFRPTLHSERPAAFVRIRIRHDSACIQTDFGVQSSVSVRRKTEMVFLEQRQVVE